MIQNIKKIIHQLFSSYFVKKNSKAMIHDTNCIVQHDSRLGLYIEGEKKWLLKWQQFDKNVSPVFYRIYQRLFDAGENSINIFPDDIGRNYIEPILNTTETNGFYRDKNSLGLIFDRNLMPRVFVRCINGKLFDETYNSIDASIFLTLFSNESQVIVKPSKDLGGHGVKLFKKNSDGVFVKDQYLLSLDYMKTEYGKNWLIQEYFVQSDFTAQFNKSSVNSFRVSTFRDIEKNKVHIAGTIFRIGNVGSDVDNVSSGGIFVGIDKFGRLQKNTWNISCVKGVSHNGIDFSQNDFQVPNYDKVIEFAKNVADRFPHMSLLAQDIVLDKNNEPKLIEVNTDCYNWCIFQITFGPMFGKYNKQIFDYCLEHKNDYKVSAYRYFAN